MGCHIGRTYAGAFGYADGIALLAPSLSGLKRMIQIFEVYAEEYCSIEEYCISSPNYYVTTC